MRTRVRPCAAGWMPLPAPAFPPAKFSAITVRMIYPTLARAIPPGGDCLRHLRMADDLPANGKG
jgi:hypothetical protein